MLENKNAVVYGAGGSLGSTIAKAFAAAGAKVFLTGRRLAPLQELADAIIADGGSAEAAEVDAMDGQAVISHLDKVTAQSGTIDISFNLIGLESKQNCDLVDMQLDDYVRPIDIAMRSHFITATAAGRIMMKQSSGVILSLTATPGGIAYPKVGGFGPACCAIESFSRDLASELGPYGVRVVNIRSGGSPDSRVFQEAIASHPEEMKGILKKMSDDTMLKELPVMADIANAAVFLASGMAGKITGTTIDITCGTSGINYKTSIPLFQ